MNLLEVNTSVEENDTLELGRTLARLLKKTNRLDSLIFLFGDLGAGKTTLVKGFLAELGYSGNVKSPTYTLLEPYILDVVEVYHFDLYRINDPQELEFIGFDEVIDGPGLKLIEWADKAVSWLPTPSISVYIDYAYSAATPEKMNRVLRFEGISFDE